MQGRIQPNQRPTSELRSDCRDSVPIAKSFALSLLSRPPFFMRTFTTFLIHPLRFCAPTNLINIGRSINILYCIIIELVLANVHSPFIENYAAEAANPSVFEPYHVLSL